MRLPDSAHTSRPWRIHEFTGDFRLEDVWALQTRGGADDFAQLVDGIASGDPSQSPSCMARALFAIRWKLGGLLGWDGADTGIGTRVPSLRDRLPADLRDTPVPEFQSAPFAPLYMLDDEFAAEIANRTVHGIMHLSWVPEDTGYRGQMAVLVRPNGVIGNAYMAAIRPFRHRIVYPALMRQIESAWRDTHNVRTADPHVCASVRRADVPPEARALSTLSHIDYADAFFVHMARPRDRTAEQWGRAIFGGAPKSLRLKLWLSWTWLGLILAAPGSDGSVLGWEVRRRTPDFLLLGARSRIGMPAELLVRRERGGLLFDTFVEQDNALARGLWARIEPAHRRVVPSILDAFSRRVRDTDGGV